MEYKKCDVCEKCVNKKKKCKGYSFSIPIVSFSCNKFKKSK